MTKGTKINEILSAKRAKGALEFAATPTKLIIFAIVVSLPTEVTLKMKLPSLFIVEPITFSPSFLYIGRDSPVIADSSIFP